MRTIGTIKGTPAPVPVDADNPTVSETLEMAAHRAINSGEPVDTGAMWRSRADAMLRGVLTAQAFEEAKSGTVRFQ